ncbi:MAG TPA: ABC transporter substrate-binding protein, partial [Mycobacteriales bacterium]|nr:ABC transporter substrate-binding protein [Mycobacteriales bacterium]
TITIGSHQPLTGPAAPGYSEIAPAANALFKYVNAAGGINGRKIKYIYKDDGYNPTQTVSVVKELVLKDKIFALFNGLGTPTHEKVLTFLDQHKVPDLFVASGSLAWNQPSKYENTFGWQTDYTVEGKILGSYVAKKFLGAKIGYLLQNDDFGSDGAKGLDMYIPAKSLVSRQTYESTNSNINPQIAALKAKGAQVIVCECIPAFTALAILDSLKIGFHPRFVVSNVGSDPTTLSGLLESFAKQGGSTVQGNQLIQGIVTDGYLPAAGDTSNSWIKLFSKIHDKYVPDLPFDGNVEYGMAAAYTFVQALKAAGKNPTRASLVAAVDKGGFSGPGLVPFRFSKTDHSGYMGTQVGVISGKTITPLQVPQTTDDAGGPLKDYTATQPEAGANGLLQP